MKVQENLQRFCSIFALALLASIGARAAGNCDGSRNCYVRAGATGTGTGANWTNACTGFTGACDVTNSALRATTLWVAVGSYGSPTFSATDSGTSVITIEAATTANHGPASDWSSSYAGQAVFGGNITIASDYWTFNGQSWGSGCSGVSVCNVDAAYNIEFHNTTYPGAQVFCISTSSCGGGGSVNNINFEYVDIYGNDGASNESDEGIVCYPTCNDLYVGHSYMHHMGGNEVIANYGGGSGNPHTYEYDYIYLNHQSYNSDHAEAFSETAAVLIVRYCVFQDIISSGFVTDASAVDPPLQDWEFYGNIFFWDQAFGQDTRNFGPTDGIVGFFGQTWSGANKFLFYNNTIAGLVMAANSACNASVTDFVTGPQVGTAIMENNLWSEIGGYCSQPSNSSGGGVTVDYNTYSNGASNSSDASSHKQQSSSNFFSTNFPTAISGFMPTTDTSAGLTLPSPYNTDISATTRGANGKWDRGALQISGTSSTAPNPPSGLTATVQ